MLAMGDEEAAVQVGTDVVVRPGPVEDSYRGRRVGYAAGDAAQVLLWMKRSAGLTQYEMARRLGVTGPMVQHYMRGRRKNPSVELLGRFAAVCGFEVRVVQR